MEIVKELSDIAEKWTEPEYRARPELSQSTLGTYEKLGFNGLDHLFDHKETPSLTFGSAVDSWLTGGEEEFNSLFYVSDFPSVGDKEKLIADYLFLNYGSQHPKLEALPATYILEAANTYEFQKNWKDETRVKVLTERCSPYYAIKSEAIGKTILDAKTFEDVQNCVRALRESPATCGCFAENDPMSPVRRYYQLKFKMTHNGVGYRGMMDLVAIDYEKKIVYPFDLKTSSHFEWDFQESFTQWRYMHQSRLYWRLLRYNMDKDDYFKDFELKDYKFIVVNRKTLTPLIWEFPLTKIYGTLVDEKGNEYRDPFDLGEELQSYLDCRPQVPNGINQFGVNVINCLKPKEN